ncbi:unnamed protein product, partial [Discosporangium mesarthrocarpum]
TLSLANVLGSAPGGHHTATGGGGAEAGLDAGSKGSSDGDGLVEKEEAGRSREKQRLATFQVTGVRRLTERQKRARRRRMWLRTASSDGKICWQRSYGPPDAFSMNASSGGSA